MARKHAGRHRAPGFNPLTEIVDIAAHTAQPAVKASAVVVASGGLLATFALPASAAPADTASGAALAAVQQAPAQAPAAANASVGSVAAVAVAAPATATNAPTFGVVGFTGTPAAAPAPAMTIKKIVKPAPAPAPTRTVRVARTTVAATGTGTTKTATPAPAPAAAPAAPVAAPRGGVLGAAAALSGIPYVYGGISTSGADCSGYTSLVFRSLGITLPRTAEAQRQFATPVSSPQPGDLIFFGFPAYHVGIYAGGGMMYDNQRPGTTSGLHSIWTYNNVSYGRVG